MKIKVKYWLQRHAFIHRYCRLQDKDIFWANRDGLHDIVRLFLNAIYRKDNHSNGIFFASDVSIYSRVVGLLEIMCSEISQIVYTKPTS